jgi:hypothetical protein
MSRGALVGLVAAAAVVVAACGAGSPQAASPDRSTTPATTPTGPSAAPGTDVNGSLVPTNLPSSLPTKASVAPEATDVPTGPDQVLGADVSWPQCPRGMGIAEKPTQGSPMPTPVARFVILGLTNGPSFTPNPCLADQVGWVAARHLRGAAYAVVSYPSADTLQRYGGEGPFPVSTKDGRLSNAGYSAALYSLGVMKAAGLKTPVVWVDVEPVPKFEWSNDPLANAAVVQGTVRGYTDAGFEVGFYSTPSLWQRVVGDLRIGLPEWRAAGQTSRAEALNRCGPDWSIQGGAAVFGQWVEAGRDRNVTCPGTSAALGRWFHQY